MTDRGEYRSIRTVLIFGPDFRKLSPRAKLVWLTLKLQLGPFGIGVFDGVESALAAQTGYRLAQIEAALAELLSTGWLKRQDNVWEIVKGLDNEPAVSPKDSKHRKKLHGYLDSLPRLAIVDAFRKSHPDWFPEDTPLEGHARPIEGPSKALPSKEERIENREDRIKKQTIGSVEPKPKGIRKYPHFPVPDSDRLHATCLSNGYVVDAGMLRKTLAPLYSESGPLHTLESLDSALIAFLEARSSVTPDKARFWTIVQFAQDVGRWIRMGAMPRQDPETGAPTERGLLLLGAA